MKRILSTGWCKPWPLFVLLTLVVAAGPAFAQTTASGIRGTVTDATGPIPQAMVRAVNADTGFAYQATAGGDGSFSLAGLTPGTYEVTVSSEAFRPQSTTLKLLVGQNVTVNFLLSPTEVFVGEVTVVGEGTRLLVDTRSPQIATNVTSEQIELLPQGERNFLNFAALAPGVHVEQNENNTQVFRSAGMSAKQVNAFIDGLSYKNDLLEGGSFMQDASKGNPFPQNAVQEFQVLTQNYKAEYEKAAAAIITAVTRSGGNEFHGDLFYQFQDDAMVTFDDLSVSRGLEEPSYERMQGALSLGGPILRDKLHFYAAYERNEQDRFNTVFYGGQWENETVPQAVRARLSQYGVGNVAAPFESSLYFGKLTWQPGTGSSVDLSFNSRDEDERRGFGGQRVAQGAERFQISTDAVIAKWTTVIGSSMFNELTGTWQEMRWFPSAFDASLPRENFFGLLDVGGKDATQDFTQERLGLRNDLSRYFSWRGDHAVKAGVSANWMDYKVEKTLFPAGLYEYRDQERWEFPFQARLGFGDPSLEFSNTQVGVYLQDDWRPFSTLTVSAGLRWDYESNMLNNDWRTPPDLLAAMRDACRTYDQPVGGQSEWCLSDILDLDQFTTSGNDRDAYYGMVQPRLGFAWDVSKEGRTVVYGGWGRYYDRVLLNDIYDEQYRHSYKIYSFCFVEGACSNPVPWDPSYSTAEGLAGIIERGEVPGPEVFLVNNDLRPPRSNQWNIGVRHQLGNWLAGLAYAGVRSYNGLAWTFADLPPGTPFRERWGYGIGVEGYARAFKTSTARRSWYDAVYLTLDRPFTADANWGFNFVYTYAEADALGPGTDGVIFALDFVGSQDFFRHPSEFDERHRIVASGTYGLPYGLRLSGILTLGSGFPFTVNDASAGWDNFVLRTGGGRFEKRSFLGWKNWVYRTVDMRLDWEVPVGGGFRVGVIGEAFNVFDFVNEGCPNWDTGYIPPAGETNPRFGQGDCHYNTRRYQVGAKVSF